MNMYHCPKRRPKHRSSSISLEYIIQTETAKAYETRNLPFVSGCLKTSQRSGIDIWKKEERDGTRWRRREFKRLIFHLWCRSGRKSDFRGENFDQFADFVVIVYNLTRRLQWGIMRQLTELPYGISPPVKKIFYIIIHSSIFPCDQSKFGSMPKNWEVL